MLIKISKFIQVALGYLLISALVDVGLDFILELITLWNVGYYKNGCFYSSCLLDKSRTTFYIYIQSFCF